MAKLDLNDGNPPISISDIGFGAVLAGHPSLDEIFEDKSQEFQMNLGKVYSKHGIAEIRALKDVLTDKIADLKKDIEAVSKRGEQGIFYLAALLHSYHHLQSKLYAIETFLSIYILHGSVEPIVSKKQLWEKGSNLTKAIKSVSIAISSSNHSETGQSTIENFLKGYFLFKSTSLGLMKIRDFVISNCKNVKMKDELENTGNSTLAHWTKRLEEKIDQIREDSFLYEQDEGEN
ncbi:hypothetical protein CK503_04165 [Aliifodinibius salipaludis]|uniref:Uncharacterized protein n=1 Tax=Fodinibius salipaludis TaxID=2032627 RepID=A0A2A2GDE6_9BACT|nr:hypothetical protein [Aliifodinibius salipaludis]PAU95398.1 hypothetical protein CK503_04165 [Aliifodinibius salipaludis]